MSMLSDDLATLSAEAYTYLYPLLTMDVSRRQQTSARTTRPVFGPANRFSHLAEFPAADFRAVVRPNFDTLYSSCWLDLTGGPVEIAIPDSGDRYYLLPMLDMWTDVVAVPGKRTTGTGPQRYVVVGPGHADPVPDGATLIFAPTPYVWVIGRTQTNGPADYAAVNEFQQGWQTIELGAPVTPAHDDDIDLDIEPLRLVNEMSATEFFTEAATVLAVNPPHSTDFSVLARISRLGLVPGKPFDASAFDDAEVAELEHGRRTALAQISDLSSIGRSANGWQVVVNSIGVYGNDYLTRARIALAGLGANPAVDAVYPVLMCDADGKALDGADDYVIHFTAGQLPPVDAFWSVTMYDAEGYQVGNELDRFAIGDRDSLILNDDGSLDLYLQHTDPGPDRVSNWLPAPRGQLGVTMRLYAPQPAILDGRWAPPVVQKS